MCLSRHKHVHVAVKYGWVSWQQSDMFYEDGKNVMLEECEGKKRTTQRLQPKQHYYITVV